MRQFADGRGGWAEQNHTTARKPGTLHIIHVILSVLASRNSQQAGGIIHRTAAPKLTGSAVPKV
jgi:hypothetical protein